MLPYYLMKCAHCGKTQPLFAHLTGPDWGEMVPVCHPDEGLDCYRLITVFGEPLGMRLASHPLSR